LGVILWLLAALPAQGYTANKIWFEFMTDGRYRVVFNYTVPELKEFREGYVIFNSKTKAQQFYWSLVRGADFYPDDPRTIRFVQPKRQPRPW
jgi:hypothetical protein